MSVNTILQTKGRKVATIEATRSLGEAARLLSEWKIGAVLVEGQKPVSGFLSERDIVKAVATKGAKALDEPVSAHMTTEIVTCTGKSDITDIMELMTQGRFRHVPVV